MSDIVCNAFHPTSEVYEHDTYLPSPHNFIQEQPKAHNVTSVANIPTEGLSVHSLQYERVYVRWPHQSQLNYYSEAIPNTCSKSLQFPKVTWKSYLKRNLQLNAKVILLARNDEWSFVSPWMTAAATVKAEDLVNADVLPSYLFQVAPRNLS